MNLKSWCPLVLCHMAVGQHPVPLVNLKIGGKWMFIHPKMARHRLSPMAISRDLRGA